MENAEVLKAAKENKRLYDELTGIQWGRIADPHGWIMKL